MLMGYWPLVILNRMLEVLINDKMKRGVIVLIFLFGAILIYFGVTELKSAIIRGTGNIDSIQVYKSKRKLMFFRNGDVSGEFRISLGFHPKGKKRYEKDGKTPEGLYEIDGKNPKSVAHKNLGISYPNQNDKSFASRAGQKAGGAIKIHGLLKKYRKLGKLHRFYDWTAGCIAVTDEEVDYLYENTAVGTPIRILP
jgi:murein L,D-transpeptidase YafK